MKFLELHKKRQCVQEEVLNFETDPEGEICTRRKVFAVQSVPRLYSQVLGNFQKDQCKKKLSHTSVVEIAVPFWRFAMPYLLMSPKVD